MNGPSLPRSIRWRLQLGLIQPPPETADEEEAKKRKAALWEIEDIASVNASKLEDQRQAYDVLIEEHEILQAVERPNVENEDGFLVEEEKKSASTADEAATAADPLTAMVQQQEEQEKRREELDRKYRKEKAKRKFGLADERMIQDEEESTDRFDTYSSQLTLGIIEKDLLRLQPEHNTYHHSRMKYKASKDKSGDSTPTQENSTLVRSQMLTEVLLVYAKEHPETGYRQGMHEICSYLMLVLEMDLLDQESKSIVETNLMRESSLEADTYHMLKEVMKGLSPAYDVKTSPSQTKSPMEDMANSILTKIRDVASDKQLFEYLFQLGCPAELYCTRWVRLMFSREVAGWSNVLLLWDVMFDLTSVDGTITSMVASKYTRPGVNPILKTGGFPLMQVLEAAAAGMILLQRKKLMQSEDTNESIHALMNVEPLPSILPLTATLLSIMRRLQHPSRRSAAPSPSSVPNNKSAHTNGNGGPSSVSSFMQMAQNSLQTLNLGGGGGSSSAAKSLPSPAAENVSRSKSTSAISKMDSKQGMSDNSSNGGIIRGYLRGTAQKANQKRQSPTKEEIPFAGMSDKLHGSLETIRQYLTKQKSSSSDVPQSVWDALADIDNVRTDLSNLHDEYAKHW